MSKRNDARIVIIGGGVIGLGIAYHLAKLGVDDVLLIERNQLTSGTSWHAAGVVGPLRASFNMTQLASYATTLFPLLEEETGQATGYRKTGGYWLARTKERMVELRRIAAMGEITGIDARILCPDELTDTIDFIRTDDLAGALHVNDDAQANPVDICMAYAKGARAGGVRIMENVSCTGIETHNGAVNGVQLSTGETVRCETVVNCAGAWARQIGTMADVPVPLQAVEHMYVVTEPVHGLPDPFPILRDLDSGIYIKGDAGKLVLGGFEPFAKPWDAFGPDGETPFLELPDDWNQFEPFMLAGLNRLPLLEQAGIQHFMNGPETFTPDSLQLLGESPFLKGFFVAAGMNSVGMMCSAGIGKAMAEWIVDGHAPMDLWAVDIARFDRLAASKSFLAMRMEEAVSDVFDMHWPYKQPKAGRNVRCGVLHSKFLDAGAVFGAPTGWERPLWFATTEAEKKFDYSVGNQCWWSAAERESLATRDNVALYELSPFGKFDVIGPDAVALLQNLCAADIDTDHGCAVYSQMLNDRGGIEADVTVTRIDDTSFRVVSGAATRWKDFAWMSRLRDHLGLRVQIFDATSSEAVIGVMGPRSRDLLQNLTSGDISAQAFPFSTSKRIDVGSVAVRATRVSFVGELGWELYIPTEDATSVYQSIVEEGAIHGLAHAGHLTLDCCRIEKGFKHWSHDIGPDDTPLEAGLSFAVAWDKPGGFIGHEALTPRRALSEESDLVNEVFRSLDVRSQVDATQLRRWCGSP
ncbi:MAG: FAD-dependent oxidoreductase [Rhodospirillales bacterium]|nr:FAD-dependent oxidoreductase [Rhodospirillales bacterium]